MKLIDQHHYRFRPESDEDPTITYIYHEYADATEYELGKLWSVCPVHKIIHNCASIRWEVHDTGRIEDHGAWYGFTVDDLIDVTGEET